MPGACWQLPTLFSGRTILTESFSIGFTASGKRELREWVDEKCAEKLFLQLNVTWSHLFQCIYSVQFINVIPHFYFYFYFYDLVSRLHLTQWKLELRTENFDSVFVQKKSVYIKTSCCSVFWRFCKLYIMVFLLFSRPGLSHARSLSRSLSDPSRYDDTSNDQREVRDGADITENGPHYEDPWMPRERSPSK